MLAKTGELNGEAIEYRTKAGARGLRFQANQNPGDHGQPDHDGGADEDFCAEVALLGEGLVEGDDFGLRFASQLGRLAG